MKTTILILEFCLISLTPLSAQWEILNEGFRGTVNTIDFVNENVGWIAGDNGTLHKSTEGGETWYSILINQSWHINQIDFINESVGWAIGSMYDSTGNYAIIIKSSNGGSTWFLQKQILDERLNSLFVIDENNAFTVGGNEIYKTTNGGTNWLDVSPKLPGSVYNSVWFQDSQTGVVVGSYNYRGIILRTTDGGINWNERIVQEFNNVYDLQFLNNTIGYFRANLDTTNYICKTEDMCATWSIITQSPDSIISYQYLDNNIAYSIMGDSISDNNIMKSTNGGFSWQKVQTTYFNSFKIYFNAAGAGFVLSQYSVYQIMILGTGRWLTIGSFIYRTVESDNWAIQKFSYPLLNLSFYNKDIGYFCGGTSGLHYDCGHIFSTNDAGNTWKPSYSDTTDLNNHSGIITDCFQGNHSTVFCLNTSYGDVSKIFKSSDSGNSWFEVFSNDSVSWCLNDIYFINEQIGFVVGKYHDSYHGKAIILNTTNGGTNWNLVWQLPDARYYAYNLFSLCFSSNAGWSVGESGLIVKYTPQTGWVKQTKVTDLPLNKVFFSDESNGWIASGYQNESGFQKILLKTTNGGANWNVVPNVPYLLRDIAFINNNLGWAIGYTQAGTGGILKTTDDGNTWEINVGSLPAKLNALHIKDGYGWAVGENGLILRTTNAGPTWVKNENQILPIEFVLEQNYPNPFNPSTKIKYSIPSNLPDGKAGVKGETSNVKLKVYDVLGREVATLVNKEQSPGVYEVEFSAKGGSASGGNACNFSSGIYLFRLQAGDFNAVKKMILLK